MRKNKTKNNKELSNCNVFNKKILLNTKELIKFIKNENTRNLKLILGKKKKKFILKIFRKFLHEKKYLVIFEKKKKINSAIVNILPIFLDKKILIKYILNEIEIFSKKKIPNILNLEINNKKKTYSEKDFKYKNIFFKSEKKILILF
ncbi:hypothetical protein ACWNYI_00135 [Candidatus Vidania fulgoroideorum]